MPADSGDPGDPGDSEALILCALLWAHVGREAELVAYEDRVLALLPDHGASLVQRVRSSGVDGQPLEVQVFRFPSRAALDAYLADERRTALTDERDRAVARTELMPVTIV